MFRRLTTSVVAIWLGFTVMAVLTFELARTFQVYDYKNFIKQLIGRAWPVRASSVSSTI